MLNTSYAGSTYHLPVDLLHQEREHPHAENHFGAIERLFDKHEQKLVAEDAEKADEQQHVVPEDEHRSVVEVGDSLISNREEHY